MATWKIETDSPSVGDNLTDGLSWALVKNKCRIVKIGFAGGSAVYDGRIVVSYGQEKIIDMYNVSATEIDAANQEFMFWNPSNKRAMPGDQINIEVMAAAAATYTIIVDIKEG